MEEQKELDAILDIVQKYNDDGGTHHEQQDLIARAAGPLAALKDEGNKKASRAWYAVREVENLKNRDEVWIWDRYIEDAIESLNELLDEQYIGYE